MKTTKSWIALLAVLALLGACKGESPTAPPTGGGPTTPPPLGAVITLTVTNPTPLVDSPVTVTASVTVDGKVAPDGTAVEFKSTAGLLDGTTGTVIRTTTNGIATVTLTSSSAVSARISATVNNVTRTIDVVYSTRPPDPTVPVDPPPTITSIDPNVVAPTGGIRVRINGTNFKPPLRVLMGFTGKSPAEVFIENSTLTTIDVLTPAIDLGVAQELAANVIVFTQAGVAGKEQRVESTGGLTFRAEVLTPRVNAASPNSGPVTGGTRITLFGDGFQAPVQVLFGSAEAKVITVQFNEILVESPAGRDTNPDGSGTVTGPVTITVRNIKSGTSTTLAAGFRYVNAVQVTAISPGIGTAIGGTDVQIDGTGFLAPVTVTVANVPAQVLRVSGSQLLVRTGPTESPCEGVRGPVIVTNVANGDSDAGPEFGYIPVQPVITSVSPGGGVPAGGSVTVNVLNPGVGQLGSANVRFTINGQVVIPSPSVITTGTGTTSFSMAIPLSGYTFATESCATGGGEAGTRLALAQVSVGFNNVTTGCTDQVENALNVSPPAPNPCLTPPQPIVTTPPGGSCAAPGTASVSGVGFPLQTQASIVIANDTEAQPLNIVAATITGANASEFRITPTTATGIAAGGSQAFTLTFDPATAGAKDALVTFTTNSPTVPTITVCVTATAAP